MSPVDPMRAMNISNKLGIIVNIYPLGPQGSGTDVGIITHENSGIVIDAPPGAASEILSIAEERGVRLQHLLITHYHWDHITDALPLKNRGLKIYAHELDRRVMEDPEEIEPKMLAYQHIDVCLGDQIVADKTTFSLCG
jgi:glyoxylase-like metal-dependent hydrolase (beta-lactamase superfamily II)